MSDNVPPPIPPRQPPPLNPSRVASPARNVKGISGAEGMTAAGLHDAVARGARFVMFQYCFSVLVLSFKRSSTIFLVKPGESALAKGVPYSLISLFAGWWGIPWGPIWTVTTLTTNFGGGKDVTREVLSALGPAGPVTALPPLAVEGPPVANAAADSRKTLILRLGWIAAAVIFLGMGWVGYKVFDAVRHGIRMPGETEFRAANAHISTRGPDHSGNTPEAAELAAQMSKAMLAIRTGAFAATKEKSFLDENDPFKAYCELDGDHCVFLVHVPELRNFDDEARKSLGQMAWLAAQKLLERKGGNPPGMRLAVGLRGIAAYDRVLTGDYLPQATEAKSGVLSIAENFGCERVLYHWFAAKQPESADATAR